MFSTTNTTKTQIIDGKPLRRGTQAVNKAPGMGEHGLPCIVKSFRIVEQTGELIGVNVAEFGNPRCRWLADAQYLRWSVQAK